MRLRNILMINRAPFEHFELELGDENLILLSGVNGAGKTTILSYIVDAFYELAKKGFSFEFEENNTKFYRISSGVFSRDSSKVSIVYLRFLQEDGTNADYIEIRGNCSQEEYETLIPFPDKIEFATLKRALMNNEVEKYWTISDKNTITTLFSNNILTYFPAYRYELPYYLNDPYKIQLEFNKEAGFSGYLTNPIEVTSDLLNIANWIMDVVLDQLNYNEIRAQSAFTELNEILTNILIKKANCKTRLGIGKRFAGASRIAVINMETGNLLYPSIFCMSSGELALLCLFGELLKQTDKLGKALASISGVVLVDEIDKHLHIKLQKEVLPSLIALFPNVQFIASSHSPFLGLGLAESGIITYKIS